MAEVTETARGVVARWEVDFFDHMNVRHYVGRFDDATWNFFAGLGMSRDYFTGNGRAMFAVQQNISYLGELRAGDIVVVETEIREIAVRRIVFEHRMRNGVSGEVAAVCELTGVHVDLATRRACPFPDEVMRAGEIQLGDRAANV